MPTSPIHTYIPTAPTDDVCILSRSPVSTSSSFECTQSIRERFVDEPEIEMKNLDRFRFNKGPALFRKNVQRPASFEIQKNSSNKRRFTFSGNSEPKIICKKRRRLASVAHPTKFLLGGNITDPLNLRSLEESSINKHLNQLTPASFPMPAAVRQNQVQVVVPPNINDPLNLNIENDFERNLPLSKTRKRRRHRKSRRDEDSIDESDKSVLSELSALPLSERSISLSFLSDLDKASEDSTLSLSSPEEKKVFPSNNDSPINIISPSKPENSITQSLSSEIENCNNSVSEKNVDDASIDPDVKSITESEVTLSNKAIPTKCPIKRLVSLVSKSSEVRITLPDSSSITSFNSSCSSKVISPVGLEPKHQGQSSTCASIPEEKKASAQKILSKRKRSKARLRRNIDTVKFRANAEKFCYGNHISNLSNWNFGNSSGEDPRLRFFNRSLFQGKDVLDIGSNAGRITIFIARYFQPNKIIGLDIDKKLINIAQRQVHRDVSGSISRNIVFPGSMSVSYGPLVKIAVTTEKGPNEYPNNVTFLEANYVPACEDELETQKGEYDTILCLRVSKWIHLNFGDEGIKLAFKRMYAQLRFGGHLIFEPQPWFTYSASKKITPSMYSTYRSLQMRPESFCDYLLSDEVGFTSCDLIGSVYNYKKDYRQPIYLLTKGYGNAHDQQLLMNISPVSFHNDHWVNDEY